MRTAALCLAVVLAYSGCKHTETLTTSDVDGIGDEAPNCLFTAAGDPPGFASGSNTPFDIDWPALLASAHASNLAYEGEDAIKSQTAAWGFNKTTFIEVGSMAAFVASRPGCVLLSFRGTDDIKDWFTNAKIASTGVPQGRMHVGFQGAYQNMKTKVLGALAAHGVTAKALWVTGHSLGGALAGVFAHDQATGLPGQTLRIDQVVTFGQPLFSNSKLADFLRRTYVGRYNRVVNERDIVAKIPPGYEHFGSLVWFHDGQVEYNKDQALMMGPGPIDQPVEVMPAEIPPELQPNQQEFDQFMQSEAEPNHETPPGEMVYGGNIGVEDHSMTNYIAKISAQL